MPATSKQQQKLMGIVHALQTGQIKPGKASEKAREMAKTMKPSDVTDFAATKHKGLPKKAKKEEGLQIPEMYLVRKPKVGMKEAELILKVNPLEGIQPLNIGMEEVHTVTADEIQAQEIAAEAYKSCMEEAFQLEEKKGKVSDKLKKTIDHLEKKRKEHLDMAKEDPKSAVKHKEYIAQLATQIDDLMTKMEKIEKSKKEIKKDAKANVKDNLGDSEKAPKKPKGVEEFKDKGVTGSFKTIKEGIEKSDWTVGSEIIGSKKHYFLYNQETGKRKGTYKSKEEAEKTIKEGLEQAQIKVGDIVIPNKGEHKGQKHKVIHVFDDGSMNIQPVRQLSTGEYAVLSAKYIKYHQGAANAKPEDIEEELKETVKEHHNDPDFPIVKGLYELLDAIVADWGKEDLYHDVEDVVVAYIDPDATTISKEAVKRIKDVLGNYDVLEDYAELVNGIAVKEPGTGFRPGVDLGASFEKFKSALKEKLKTDLKKEAGGFGAIPEPVTKMTSQDPETGKITWDVTYDVKPQELHKRLDDIIKFLERVKGNSYLDDIRMSLRNLRAKTHRLMTQGKL